MLTVTADAHNSLLHLYLPADVAGVAAAAAARMLVRVCVCVCVTVRHVSPALSTDSRPVAVTQHMVNLEQRCGWTIKKRQPVAFWEV